ncbi:uncharacterized protein LOC121422392 [Lytechinus variegatus]|uniref:uncharacterized protein LOC121422392 n=1 Tax=Lytechinus variegatus TaxID=7654 RepID=UPI001BB1F24F|nr:uncharacterized protein LOC121422392 [Lytechinus variegatus]
MEEIIAKLEVCMATLDKIATKYDSQAENEERGRPLHTSMVRVNGKPILPPLMTPDKRSEMIQYQAQAIERERERQERRRQHLVERVETIVNSYEDSRQSLGSKDNSPQQAATAIPDQTMQVLGMQSVDSKQVPHGIGNPSYSPLKYMEMDEEEWNVRPATPWRRTKQAKAKTVIAANFDSRGHQPISSTMRMDHSQDVRGTTPDVSAISVASSQAGNSLPFNSLIDAVDPTLTRSVQPVLKEVLSSSPPGLADLKAVATDGTAAPRPVDVSSSITSDVNSNVKNDPSEPQEVTSSENSTVRPPDTSAVIDSAVISRLSPIPKMNAVQPLSTGVTGSTGTQSTNSSTNSALNQTVIDLSQMSLAQGQSTLEKAGDSPKSEKNKSDSQSHSSAEANSKVEPPNDDISTKDVNNVVSNTQEDNHVAGYLSDTESYMSLLGEYSLLPTPGSNRGTPDPIPTRNAKKVPFFADPTSPDATNVNPKAEVPVRTSEMIEENKNGLPAADASVDPLQSLKSVDGSEYCGSSLGTLGQSVTLPISLSVTSESTLHGVEETWDRTSQEMTPTGTEGAASIASDELTNAGMVRAAPVGQESNAAAAEIIKETVEKSEESARQPSPSVGKPSALPSGKTFCDEKEKGGVKVERSGVKIDSDFQTPLRHHARKSSYTLDFPSPALLDAEARHQAPHISGRNVSYNEPGSKSNDADEVAVKKAEAEEMTASDEKQPCDLSSELNDLKIDDVTEAKVLSLQLSCLEQMQQRLQRQHEEQMKELMLQQSQEIVLLQSEMEGIRRQAAQSALGHVHDQDSNETPNEVTNKPEEIKQEREDKSSSKETSPNITSIKTSPDKNDKSAQDPMSQRKGPPTSPNSRKRRFEESSEATLVQVPPSYIKQSSLVGKGYASPGFFSPVGDKPLLNAKKKLTPQDSLDSDHGGLVEVPPSYIRSGSYHRPVSRSPTHQRASTTPKDTTAASALLGPSTIPAEESSTADSSRLTTWGTPVRETHDRDSTRLSTQPSPAEDTPKGPGHLPGASVSDPVYVNSLSDSFFLNDGQTGEAPDRNPDHHQQTSNYFRPWTITPSLQMDSRFDKISARVKGHLTRALMRTPKVKALVKTIKDTRVFLYQFQAETPVKRGKLSEQDMKLAHRVLAQLRAAQYELDDIFHVFPISQRMAILRHAREQERENYFNKKVSPPSAGQKSKLLSAATKKAMERRQQQAKEGDIVQSGPKRQKLVPSNQRPKSAAETRVLRPLQSQKSPARPATAAPPRTSSFSITTKSQKGKPSVLSKPFPTKPVMVSRHTSKATRSPSRSSSRSSSRSAVNRPGSTRPTSRLSLVSTGQAKTSSVRQGKSPARAATGTGSQTKTKSVRRSLYPASVGTGKKTMQRKQTDTRKP